MLATSSRSQGILTRLRERQGLSQSEVARTLHVKPSTISRIESGEKRPSVAVLHGLLHVLGASAGETVIALKECASANRKARVAA